MAEIRKLTGDEYMQLLLQRQTEWLDAHPGPDNPTPLQASLKPLLETFVLPGDEELFTPPN